jgi:hypothetical protein
MRWNLKAADVVQILVFQGQAPETQLKMPKMLVGFLSCSAGYPLTAETSEGFPEEMRMTALGGAEVSSCPVVGENMLVVLGVNMQHYGLFLAKNRDARPPSLWYPAS